MLFYCSLLLFYYLLQRTWEPLRRFF